MPSSHKGLTLKADTSGKDSNNHGFVLFCLDVGEWVMVMDERSADEFNSLS